MANDRESAFSNPIRMFYDMRKVETTTAQVRAPRPSAENVTPRCTRISNYT